jgi:glucose-6-phosphate dehydrogenase assembly protein OpcA
VNDFHDAPPMAAGEVVDGEGTQVGVRLADGMVSIVVDRRTAGYLASRLHQPIPRQVALAHLRDALDSIMTGKPVTHRRTPQRSLDREAL